MGQRAERSSRSLTTQGGRRRNPREQETTTRLSTARDVCVRVDEGITRTALVPRLASNASTLVRQPSPPRDREADGRET